MADFLARLEQEEANANDSTTLKYTAATTPRSGTTHDAEISFDTLVNQIVANDPGLSVVTLRYRNLDLAQVRDLSTALLNNTHIHTVQLTGNEFNKECVEYISEMLLANKKVTTLDLRFCELTDDCTPLLVSAVQQRSVPTEEIMLMGNHLSTIPISHDFRIHGGKFGKIAPADGALLVAQIGHCSHKVFCNSSPDSEEAVKKAIQVRAGPRKADKFFGTNTSHHSSSTSGGKSPHPDLARSFSVTSVHPSSHPSHLPERSRSYASGVKMTSPAVPTGPVDPETVQKYLERIEDLERSEHLLLSRVAELEQEKAKLADKEKKKVAGEVKKSKLKINLKNVQVNEQIAEAGGSGAVIYNCLVDGWQCAMKEMNLRDVPEYSMKAFETEIELLERLPFHPNIVRYLFHERKGDKLRLFMTKYSTSLRKIIQKRKEYIEKKHLEPFSALEIAKWSVAICAGLEFLHKQKVVHRDMKPDNVLCTLDAHDEVQTLAISDFDTAKTVTRSHQAKTVIGTPSYMAPEVISSQNREQYGYAADVWSFGMTLYELLTLKEPYEDEDKFEVATLIMSGTRPKLPTNLPKSYNELVDLYQKLTVKDPKARPELRDVRDLLQQMQWSLQSDS